MPVLETLMFCGYAYRSYCICNIKILTIFLLEHSTLSDSRPYNHILNNYFIWFHSLQHVRLNESAFKTSERLKSSYLSLDFTIILFRILYRRQHFLRNASFSSKLGKECYLIAQRKTRCHITAFLYSLISGMNIFPCQKYFAFC